MVKSEDFGSKEGCACALQPLRSGMLGKGGRSRTEPTIRVPASGLSQRSVPEARILWLEAKVTLIFPSSEIGVEMEAQSSMWWISPSFPLSRNLLPCHSCQSLPVIMP